MRSTRRAPSMVEYDPRIQDEWITMEKEKSDTQVAKKCHTCVTLRVAWQNLVELSHMCLLVCFSISSLLTAAKEKTSKTLQCNYIR